MGKQTKQIQFLFHNASVLCGSTYKILQFSDQVRNVAFSYIIIYLPIFSTPCQFLVIYRKKLFKRLRHTCQFLPMPSKTFCWDVDILKIDTECTLVAIDFSCKRYSFFGGIYIFKFGIINEMTCCYIVGSIFGLLFVHVQD